MPPITRPPTTMGAPPRVGRTSPCATIGITCQKPQPFAPSVVNSAVLGQTNAAGFDTVCVAIVTGPNFVLAHFDDWLSDHIGKITPRKLLIIEELPLLASGKVDKPKLKSIFAEVGEYGTRTLVE